MSQKRVICFDVDETVTPGASWETLSKSMGVNLDFHRKLYMDSESGILPIKEAEESLLKEYLQTGKATKQFIEKVLSSIDPFPEVHDIMSFFSKRDFRVYLVSGSVNIFIQMISRKLNTWGWFANSHFEFDEVGILSKIGMVHGQGKEKVRQLYEISKIENVDIREIFFVGDGTNDIPAFIETGNGISVNSKNKELNKVAWHVVNNLESIKEFF